MKVFAPLGMPDVCAWCGKPVDPALAVRPGLLVRDVAVCPTCYARLGAQRATEAADRTLLEVKFVEVPTHCLHCGAELDPLHQGALWCSECERSRRELERSDG